MKTFLAFLASLKLAVILLVLLLVGLSAGTIVESRAGVEAAGRLVYYSWWFLVLQGLFAVNVALSIADLFPWGKKRIGFVVLHASLLLIFAGSAVTYFFKIEGSALPLGGRVRLPDRRAGPRQLGEEHARPALRGDLQDFVLETYPGTMRPVGLQEHREGPDRDTGAALRRADLDEQPAANTGATPSSSRATSRTAAGRRRCCRWPRTPARTSSSPATSPWCWA